MVSSISAALDNYYHNNFLNSPLYRNRGAVGTLVLVQILGRF